MANITYNPTAIANKRFGGPGGTAVTSTPEQLAIKQAVLVRGSTIAERSVDLHADSSTATSAPSNATAAPTKGSGELFTGLCEALNQHQQELVKKKDYEIADEYVITFADKSISNAQVVKPGPLVYKNTAQKNTDTAQAKLDNSTDQLAVNSQTWQVTAGTQVVQLIDQVMRSSRYVTDQQLGNYNEDGKWVPSKTANTKTQIAWYKISVGAQPLGYDKKRRDYAYRMTFTVSPYRINQMDSQYFPPGSYLGAHKAYEYWFTGLNSQILSYEQEYNCAYYTTITGDSGSVAQPPPAGRDQRKRTYMATSEQRGQGQANYVNEPADSASSFLYSVADFAEVHMKILGDPAWLQQGEVSTGVNAQTFNYKPFNPDGTINYDSQQVTFTVSFNRPTDYNFSTGIMNTNSGSGAPKETFVYLATTCRSVFSKGQFTQELVGSLLPLGSNPGPSTNARSTASTATTDTGSRPASIPQSQSNAQDPQNSANAGTGSTVPDDGSRGYAIQDETGQVSNIRKNEYGDLYYPAEPQPAAPPKPASSSGDVAPSTTSAPGNASDLQQFSFGSLANNISSGFSNFNNNLNARLTGLNKPPQIISKDDS